MKTNSDDFIKAVQFAKSAISDDGLPPLAVEARIHNLLDATARKMPGISLEIVVREEGRREVRFFADHNGKMLRSLEQ